MYAGLTLITSATPTPKCADNRLSEWVRDPLVRIRVRPPPLMPPSLLLSEPVVDLERISGTVEDTWRLPSRSRWLLGGRAGTLCGLDGRLHEPGVEYFWGEIRGVARGGRGRVGVAKNSVQESDLMVEGVEVDLYLIDGVLAVGVET